MAPVLALANGASLALRPYQSEALAKSRDAENRGVRRQLGVAATGLGKTVLFVSKAERLAAERGTRSLILAHRDELISQAVDKVRQWWPDADIGVVQGPRHEVNADVVVASVQSLHERRLARLDPAHFDGGMIVVDEAHHAAAPSYVAVLNYFGCGPDSAMRRDEAPLLFGVTATADRGDGKGLDDIFDEIVFTYDILWGIRAGFLSDLRGVQVLMADLDLSDVKVTRGDYNEGQLGEALEEANAPEHVVASWLQHASTRRTIVFVPTIALAQETAEEFRASGITAESVSGVPMDERRAILRRFKKGETQVLTNCAVLCLDEDTEILTDRGWVGPDEMTYSHRVANWADGRVHFVEPKDIVVRDREPGEAMYVLETARRSIRVTSRHRMLYRGGQSSPWLKAPVDDLAGLAVQLPTGGLAEPLDVGPKESWVHPLHEGNRRRAISATAYNLRKREGFSFDDSKVEAARRVDRRAGLRRTPPAKLTPAECRLIGFWMGDGSYQRGRRGGMEYTLSQSKANPLIVEWVDRTLGEIGLDFVRHERDYGGIPHVRWSLARGTGGGSQERRGVYGIEPYLDKDGSAWLWGLDAAQFEALIEGLWMADGDHGDGLRRRSGRRIVGWRKATLDRLQAIAVVRGMGATITKAQKPREPHHRQLWVLHLTNRTTHAMGGTDPRYRIQREDKDWKPERVWCVKTDTKNIITRRRGTVTVMGNTEGFDEPATDCIVVARPTKSRALYAQMVGRGTRKFPGKADCLVLDVVGAASEHDLASIPSLFGIEKKEGFFGGEVTVLEALDEQEETQRRQGALVAREVELFHRLREKNQVAWVKAGSGNFAASAGEETVVMVPGSSDDLWTVRVLARNVAPRTLMADVDLELAQGVGDDFVRRTRPAILADPTAAWRKRRPSPGALAAAAKWQVKVPMEKGKPAWNAGQVSEAIDAAVAKARLRDYERQTTKAPAAPIPAPRIVEPF